MDRNRKDNPPMERLSKAFYCKLLGESRSSGDPSGMHPKLPGAGRSGFRFELEKMPVASGVRLPGHFAMKLLAKVLFSIWVYDCTMHCGPFLWFAVRTVRAVGGLAMRRPGSSRFAAVDAGVPFSICIGGAQGSLLNAEACRW
jgi:hypothetical protein